MTKLTLTKDFLEKLLLLDPRQCTSVLAVCKQLLDVDDDNIENVQLAPGTSQLVVKLLDDMKRRHRAARRRRELREAKAAREAAEAESRVKAETPAVPVDTASAEPTAEPRKQTYTSADYHRVVEALLSGSPTRTGSQYVLIL